MSLLTPARRRGVEILDDTRDAFLQRRSHRDIALAHRLFGGVRAVLIELEPYLDQGSPATLLDVGTGTGDIPDRLRREAARRNVSLDVFGLDGRPELVRATREFPVSGVCGDAMDLPFASRAFDFVIASQVLHHFAAQDAMRLIQEMHRVARRRVIIADLRRSWVAVAGLWLISFPLGFHRVSRHDGIVSILRGFEASELRDLVQQAVGVAPSVQRRAGWRVTASWKPEDPER
ncbi:MAG TPA: methyltransferase domain-containing protein [Gemmatimonadaceae bacterium]